MGKVSVIMPAYNAEKYIAESIESLLVQTLSDWELIVVNDGSTDNTLQVIERFTDPRIKVITQQNQGEAAARNRGLDTAVGEYIAFLDSDDLYLPDALTSLSHYLDDHIEYDVVFSDGYICDAQGEKLMRLSEHRPDIYTGDILQYVVLSGSVIGAIHSTMTRQATINSTNTQFDTDLVIGPDWDFWIQLARFAKFGYLDQLTCMYRVHQSNVTRTSGTEKRYRDLLTGRFKVWNADWFHDLPGQTRCLFAYNLVVDLLAGKPEEQQKVFESDSFQKLPDWIQADIFRLTADDYIIKAKEPEYIRYCLEQAIIANPSERKSRYVLRLVSWSPALGRLVLLGWRQFQRINDMIRGIGTRKPKPVPSALAPLTK